MTLRTKLLALFLLLAVGPLLAVGLIGYALSLRAVVAQLESQTRIIAERGAEEIRRNVNVVESDLALLASNAETERLLALRPQHTTVDSARLRASLAAVDTFFSAAWELFNPVYGSIELRDSAGSTLLRLGAAGSVNVDPRQFIDFVVPANGADGSTRGSVRGLVRLESLLPAEVLDTRFGYRGTSAVVDRRSGTLLHFAHAGDAPAARRLADAGLLDLRTKLETNSGAFRLGTGDSARIGWLTSIAQPPLTVIAMAELDEFAAPFRQQRVIQIATLLLIAGGVVTGGAYLLRRATRSLEELTLAADRVAHGDLSPELPAAGRDEVGRLTAAFRVMVSEVRRTMSEIEQSRQLAAIGEFAAELSHEIRNPLTAIKLNLQRLERMVGTEGVPPTAAKPVAIALGEIKRLDRVVRSVLRLGRPTTIEHRELALNDVVRRALELVRPQLESAAIELHVEGESVQIVGDSEQLVGVLVNLLLNAIEAMPAGGRLQVRTALTENAGVASADILIADSGTGIPEATRAKLFNAFVTTKPEGTGLGLALALRTAEAHGGTITLLRSTSAGTEFRIRLPAVGPTVRT